MWVDWCSIDGVRSISNARFSEFPSAMLTEFSLAVVSAFSMFICSWQLSSLTVVGVDRGYSNFMSSFSTASENTEKAYLIKVDNSFQLCVL